jgi:hypothetical protein
MPHTLTRSGLTVTGFTALLIFSFLGFGAIDAHAGKIYKWVDEHGVVTFGDKEQRPESTPAETVKIDTYVPPAKPPAKEGDAAKATKEAKDAADKQKQAAAEPKMSAAEKRKLCTQARGDLSAIQAHGQVREKDAKGNLTYLSEEQKQARIKAANKSIQEYCH